MDSLFRDINLYLHHFLCLEYRTNYSEENKCILIGLDNSDEFGDVSISGDQYFGLADCQIPKQVFREVFEKEE